MYSDAVEGLDEVLPPIVGIKRVQNGEPQKIHDSPLLYTLFAGFLRNRNGGLTANHYQVMLRLAIPIPASKVNGVEPFEYAEAQLVPFVNAIPRAIDANPQLGAIPNTSPPSPRCNVAMVTEARSGEDEGFIAIGGTLCRCITFMLEVVEKSSLHAGI